MKFERCKQPNLTCFHRTKDGNCVLLNNTEFKKPCPFAKSLNQECQELFDDWENNYSFMSFKTYVDMLEEFYNTQTYRDIKHFLNDMYIKWQGDI